MKTLHLFGLLPGKRRRSQAFSLIELLVVMAIMGIFVAVSIVSLVGTSQSRQLSSAGNLVADLANQARQNSIAQNVLTALVVVQKSGNSNWDGRLFILEEMGANQTTWTPVSKWQELPPGITLDPSQSQTFLASPTLTYNIDGLNYEGTTFPTSALAYQIFMPDGRLLTNTTTTTSVPFLYLVPGFVQGGANIVYMDKGGANGNYYEITINPFTGTSIVNRP